MKYLKISILGSMMLFVWLLNANVSYAQSYIRYVNEEDLNPRKIYENDLLTPILLPINQVRLSQYPPINRAADELWEVLRNPDVELLQVWVCGSTSPDGLWEDNVDICRRRTDEAVRYIQERMHIPDHKIHSECLYEDWDRLYDMVSESYIPYKDEVLYIIKNKSWGERKRALQRLDGGRVWNILSRDFFPELRAVRFAIFCKWEPSKPYMKDPSIYYVPDYRGKEVVDVRETRAVRDTIYIRDTVYIMKETVYIDKGEEQKGVTQQSTAAPVAQKPVQQMGKVLPTTPWYMALKTDLISDGVAIPALGMEIQLSEKYSLDLSGWYSKWAYINKCDEFKVYGARPDVKYWFKGAMTKGFFIGVHANIVWYTLMSNGTYLYQNASLCKETVCTKNHFMTIGDKKYHDTPAWSVGLTLGYSFSLDRNRHWNLEFVSGIGYGQYSQNIYEKSNPWKLITVDAPESKGYVGVTRVNLNLVYKFSVRKYKK